MQCYAEVAEGEMAKREAIKAIYEQTCSVSRPTSHNLGEIFQVEVMFMRSYTIPFEVIK